jgi:hypothetical protein
MITQEFLKQLFYYDKENGIFTRKIATSPSVKVGDIAGHLSKAGYIKISVKNKRYYAHRLAWMYEYGYLPIFIDHVNNVRQDNKINNLRECTAQQNNHNSIIAKNNTSGVKGVCWHKASEKWIAKIKINKKNIHIGLFKSIDDAKKNIEDYRKMYHKEFANNG